MPTTYADIFSSPSSCACGHCRSVFSPAAYVVDLLQWLDAKPVGTGTLRDVLIGEVSGTALLAGGRRPDLATVSLSCENGERALPYIDLVLEVLENAVDNGNGTVGTGAAHDSEVETPAMLASPQHRSDAAYTTLLSARQCLDLPFHQPLAEARTFLAHLGIPRLMLLDAFMPLSAATGATLRVASQLEALGVSSYAYTEMVRRESDVAVDPAVDEQAEEDFWPLALDAADDPTWLTNLSKMSVFRRATRLSWPEILDLVHVRYVNPHTWNATTSEWEPEFQVLVGADACDLATYTLVQRGTTADPLTLAQVARIRQFIRLSRGTGWSFLVLDKILNACGVTALSTVTAPTWRRRLAEIRRIELQTGQDPVSLASWRSSTLDTWNDRETAETPVESLYSRVFLNPAVLSPTDSRVTDWALNAAGTALANESSGPVTIAANLDVLAGALSLTGDELSRLLAALTLSTANVTLVNVTALFKWASIGRACGLSPADAHWLAASASLAPTGSGDNDDGWELIRLARFLDDQGWSIDEVRYVVDGSDEGRAGVTDTFLQTALGRVRDLVIATYDTLTADSNEGGVRELLLRSVATELGIDRSSMEVLSTLSWASNPLPTVTLPPPQFTLAAETEATLPAGETVSLPPGFACTYGGGTAIWLTVVSPATSVTATVPGGTVILVPQGTTWTGNSGAAAVLAAATPYTLATGKSVLVPSGTEYVTASGTAGSFSAETMVTLVGNLSAKLGSSRTVSMPEVTDATTALSWLLRVAFREGGTIPAGHENEPYSDLTRATWETDFELMDAFAKVALILNKLGLDERESAFWFGADALEWGLAAPVEFDANATPTTNALELEALIRLFGCRARLPGTYPAFVDVLAAAAITAGSTAAPVETDFTDAVATRTGWASDDLAELTDGLYDDGQIGELQTASGLWTFLDRTDVVRRLSARAATIRGWAVADTSISSPVSGEIVFAASSRHETPEAWGTVARPLRDVLRKAQRDALVAHLLATSGQTAGDAAFRDAEDLYQHYLIDVSMNPEMLTSRLKQAACSVQLFVHRLALGLELDNTGTAPLYELNDDERKEWDWMRTYRVWEAARKVFLYPENFVEPELRTSASPFFRSLQSELGQGELSEERVSDATLAYLEKLQTVAHLEVVAYFHESETIVDSDGVATGQVTDQLHVFARTRGSPSEYYYAIRESSGVWGAWEKLDNGVEGAHLYPIIYNRRLILFWAVFDPGTYEETPGDETTTHAQHSVRISWSERRGAAWTKAQTSTSVISYDGPLTFTEDPETVRGVIFESLAASETDNDAPSLAFGSTDARYLPVRLPLGGNLYPNGSGIADERYLEEGFDWRAPSLVAQEGAPVSVPDGDGSNEGAVLGVDSWHVIPLLGSPSDDNEVRALLGHQSDFNSQRPFFISWGTRTWLVERVAEVVVTEDVGNSAGADEGTSSDGMPEAPPIDGEMIAGVSGTYYAGAVDIERALRATFELVSASEETEVPAESTPTYRFTNFYHPHDNLFLKAVRRDGVFALLNPAPGGPEDELTVQHVVGAFDFDATLDPTAAVDATYPVEDIAFGWTAPYALYNWELFVHLPWYIANQLMADGQHDEAMKWFHCLFDPRRSTVGDWWRAAPLAKATTSDASDWFTFVGEPGSTARAEFDAQVAAWRDDPFNPHLVATMRPGAYAKAIFMRYVDNLVAWGDHLFTRDTIESNNEATQLYVYAKQLLGDKPEELQAPTPPAARTYLDLITDPDVSMDSFGNATLENYDYGDTQDPSGEAYSPEIAAVASVADVAYFCIPQNDQLGSYWDTVADRLFKLRNGMNIEGVARSLPLFEPPIDPAMLVRASAAGVDIGSAVDDLDADLPNYRFNVMLSRAQGIAGSVRTLSGALLSALEKKDAERLAVLRTEHESALNARVLDVRRQQVEEAQLALEGLRRSKLMTRARLQYYDRLLEKGLNADERAAVRHTAQADSAQSASEMYSLLGSVLGWLPDLMIGLNAGSEIGGEMVGRVYGSVSSAFGMSASIHRAAAGRLTTSAQNKRRAEEWRFQKRQAQLELDQMDRQIAAARVREQMAIREVSNQERQIDESARVLEFMTSKWTNGELYEWMSGQLSTLAFQSYQLALATAKKAQVAYRHETGRDSDAFVQSVYWDSLRKGLLSGERLAADLERMDTAFLDADRREHELTKHVSLSRLDPIALARLRQEGECYFQIPEVEFDLDCPGHYFRRVQSVALSISAVSGQQASVNAQLTMHKGEIRRKTTDTLLTADPLTDYPSIVTSITTQDSGLFQADLRDPRYLPFERRGAVSQWHLKLTAQTIRQLDWDSITDVVLHMRYTARDGGAAFAASREAALDLTDREFGLEDLSSTAVTAGAVFVLSAKRDDPDTLFAAQEAATATLSLAVSDAMLGALASPVARTLERVMVIPVLPAGGTAPGSITVDGATLTSGSVGGTKYWLSAASPTVATPYAVALTTIDFSQVDDLILVLVFT